VEFLIQLRGHAEKAGIWETHVKLKEKLDAVCTDFLLAIRAFK
jgi:hypothetical protein